MSSGYWSVIIIIKLFIEAIYDFKFKKNCFQSFAEITSDAYLDFIKEYVAGIGPWKDTLVPVSNNYLQTPNDLVARAHAHDLQVCCSKLFILTCFASVTRRAISLI